MSRVEWDENGEVIWPRLLIGAVVVKRNGRLQINRLEGEQETLYIPPDFIYNQLHSRQPLIDLAAKMIYYDEIIDQIIEFETSMRP